MKVKICGITNAEDALLCANEGADAIGFIFVQESRRRIEPAVAARISSMLPPLIMKIGVFVNETPAEVNRIAREAGLNAVQLHGEQSPGFINEINLPVIKAFRVKEGFNFNIINRFEGCGILLDSFSPDSPGGTGIQFDSSLIPEYLRSKIIIAGGVSSINVRDIADKIKPAGIDLSSSLESAPGKKDPVKIKEFFKIIRSIKC